MRCLKWVQSCWTNDPTEVRIYGTGTVSAGNIKSSCPGKRCLHRLLLSYIYSPNLSINDIRVDQPDSGHDSEGTSTVQKRTNFARQSRSRSSLRTRVSKFGPFRRRIVSVGHQTVSQRMAVSNKTEPQLFPGAPLTPARQPTTPTPDTRSRTEPNT